MKLDNYNYFQVFLRFDQRQYNFCHSTLGTLHCKRYSPPSEYLFFSTTTIHFGLPLFYLTY